jgi:hypothetical protein
MEDNSELTQDQLDLLDELEPGEAKGNVTLKDALDWDNDDFLESEMNSSTSGLFKRVGDVVVAQPGSLKIVI